MKINKNKQDKYSEFQSENTDSTVDLLRLNTNDSSEIKDLSNPVEFGETCYRY